MDRKDWNYLNWMNKRAEDKSAFIFIGPNEKINIGEINKNG